MPRSEHVVRFHGADDERLVDDVAAYLSNSLGTGGAAVVIAAESRRASIALRLRSLRSPEEPELKQRLVLLDDAETLAAFMRDGDPDRTLFDHRVGKLVRQLVGRFGRLRAYGEMVGRLWRAGAFAAAIELERLWNSLLEELEFDLYCGYPIDVLGEEFQFPTMRPLLTAHDRLVPSLPQSFERAMRRAIDDVLGERPHGLHPVAGRPQERQMPGAEATILRLRSALPRYADEILTKAKEYAV